MTATTVDLAAIDVDALTAALTPTDPAPAAPPKRDPDEFAPPVAVAINEALNKLYPGDSKSATERRKRIWDAIWEELHDVECWGVEIPGRLPIGDPVVFGNAIVEVDGYGDAVSFTTTSRAWPLWDQP